MKKVYLKDGTPTELVEGSNLLYSKEEIDTGKIFYDGKKIYRKVIEIPMFSIVTTSIPHGIDDFSAIIKTDGCFKRPDVSNITYPLNNVYMGEWNIDQSNINIVTKHEYVTFYGHIIVYYTKK